MRKAPSLDEMPLMSVVSDGLTLAGNLVSAGSYEISEHVVRSITGGGISIQEIEDAIIKGKLIEIHSNPMRGKSFLVVGYTHKKPLHAIFAEPKDDLLSILMSYYPSPPIWKDPETRAPKGDNAVIDADRKCFFCGEKIKDITVGNFDYRIEGKLYVVKEVPAGLCLGCGEKYVSAKTAKKIGELVAQGKDIGKEGVFVFKFE